MDNSFVINFKKEKSFLLVTPLKLWLKQEVGDSKINTFLRLQSIQYFNFNTKGLIRTGLFLN